MGVDTTDANRELDTLENRVDGVEDKITNVVTRTDKQLKIAFDKSMGVMRASYAMVSGFAQILGGDMGAIFASIYGVAVAGITTYQSIAAAMAAVPGAQLQAVLMTMSLVSALVSLGGVITGQTELSSRVSGLNLAVNSIGSLLGEFNF